MLLNHVAVHSPIISSSHRALGCLVDVVDGYGEHPPSPYRAPDDLAFLGDGVIAFHRHPSLSESGYSTPDSKQPKRVVYEVIV